MTKTYLMSGLIEKVPDSFIPHDLPVMLKLHLPQMQSPDQDFRYSHPLYPIFHSHFSF